MTACPCSPRCIRLELCFNELSGTIPADWELPETLSWLDLGSNLLTGTIPPNWSLSASMNGEDGREDDHGVGLYANNLTGGCSLHRG